MLRTYKRIFSLLTPRDRRTFALVILLILGAGLAEVVGVAAVIPLLAVVAEPQVIETNRWLKAIHDWLGYDGVNGFLGSLCLAVFAMLMLSVAVRVTASYITARFTRNIVLNLSQSLLTKFLRNPYEWYLSRHSADLAKTLLAETKEVVNGSITPAIKFISDGIIAAALVIFLIQLQPLGALVTAGFIGLAFALIWPRLRRLLERLGEERRVANRERFQISQEALGGIKDVKVLGLEDYYINRFWRPSHRLARHMAALQLISELPRYVLEMLGFGSMLLLLYILIISSQGQLETVLPLLGAFTVAGLRLLPTIQVLFKSSAQMRFHLPAIESLFDELNEATGPGPAPLAGPPVPLKEALRLENLSYGYPGSAARSIHEVSLTIPARSICGFVGPSGAGKTTLIDIILGLLPASGGRLTVDGVGIDRSNVRAWQQSIGYVQQNIHLVDDTIAANIGFGVPAGALDPAQVEHAARLASLHDFVADLPAGYDTMIGEKGVRLSGGQRQRIAIARALYRDPEVVIFDEATSALDTVTEKAVMEAIGRLGGRKTVIVVTHRLSTIGACNKVFVLRDGRLEAEGRFEDLAGTSETLKRLLASASTVEAAQ